MERIMAMPAERRYNMKSLLKFLGCAGFGLGMFLVPLPGAESGFATGLSVITDWIDKGLQAAVPQLLFLLVVLSALGAVLLKFVRPAWVMSRPWLASLFDVSMPYLMTRITALAVASCVFFGVGPALICSNDVGGSMMGLAQTLIAIAISLSFILPFLTECGIMEFVGILLRPLTRPLFHVPGRASVDLIASWLASSNTAVLITAGQYHNGYYSRREAAAIMTNFSLVSIPFCMVVAETLHLSDHFLLLYGSVTVIGLLLAIIGVRIWPLGSIPEAYCGRKCLAEEVPQEQSLFRWAMLEALARAEAFELNKAFADGVKMTLGILMELIPIVIAWGTVGTLLVNETPIFQWISYPMGLYMSMLGIEGAMEAAPAALAGFIDMFIPALITSPDAPLATRFVIGALSLVQIIYLTEVGSIIVKSNVGLDLRHLFVIFLERTVIALPLIVLVAKCL